MDHFLIYYKEKFFHQTVKDRDISTLTCFNNIVNESKFRKTALECQYQRSLNNFFLEFSRNLNLVKEKS